MCLLLLSPIIFNLPPVVTQRRVLHSLVVTGVISFYHLNQSAQSPLTSHISTVSLEMVVGSIPVDQQVLRYPDQPMWHQQPGHV